MHRYIGYLAVYSWCFVTAFSMLLTSEVSQQLGPFTVCFFTFFSVTSIFLFYNSLNLRALWGRIWIKRLMYSVMGINLSSFASWGLMIYPLTYLQPTLVATLILGINPIATVVINRLFLKQEAPHKLLGTSLALFGVIIFLSLEALQGESSIQGTSYLQVVFSLLCCYLAGVAASINNVLAKRIMANECGVVDVMCLRFYLTIIISGVIVFSTGQVDLNQKFMVSILFTTLAFVIIPLVLLQIALKKLDPLRVSIISPLMPVLVVMMQLYGNVNSLTLPTISATVITWLLVSLGTYWAMRKN